MHPQIPPPPPPVTLLWRRACSLWCYKTSQIHYIININTSHIAETDKIYEADAIAYYTLNAFDHSKR